MFAPLHQENNQSSSLPGSANVLKAKATPVLLLPLWGFLFPLDFCPVNSLLRGLKHMKILLVDLYDCQKANIINLIFSQALDA